MGPQSMMPPGKRVLLTFSLSEKGSMGQEREDKRDGDRNAKLKCMIAGAQTRLRRGQ